jgi:hypothetical protein
MENRSGSPKTKISRYPVKRDSNTSPALKMENRSGFLKRKSVAIL